MELRGLPAIEGIADRAPWPDGSAAAAAVTDAEPSLVVPQGASSRNSAASRAAELLRRNAFLILLLCATFFLRVLWAAVFPAFQAPDELAHFAYVQDLGEEWTLTPNDEMPTNITVIGELATTGGLPFNPEAIQDFQPGSRDGWKEEAIADLPRDLRTQRNEGEVNPARDYPPLYYFLASLVYRPVAGQDALTILFTIRVFSAVLSTLTILFGYLALKRFFGQEMLAAGTILAITFMPMYIYMGAAINPEVLVCLLFAVLIYLMTRALEDGLSFRTNLAMAIVIGLGLWTKQTFLVAIPMYLTLFGFLYLRGKLSIGDAARHLGVAAAALLVMTSWLYLGGFIRTSPDYTGEDPVTQTRSLSDFKNHFEEYWPFFRWTFDTFWGMYGWIDTPLTTDLYEVIRIGTAVAAVGLVALLLTSVYRRALDARVLFYLALSVIFVAAFIVINYLRITSGEVWLLQGRYFFPVIVPIIALLMHGALWYVPQPNRRRVLLAVIVAGVLWLQTDALFTYVIPRYYL